MTLRMENEAINLKELEKIGKKKNKKKEPSCFWQFPLTQGKEIEREKKYVMKKKNIIIINKISSSSVSPILAYYYVNPVIS